MVAASTDQMNRKMTSQSSDGSRFELFARIELFMAAGFQTSLHLGNNSIQHDFSETKFDMLTR